MLIFWLMAGIVLAFLVTRAIRWAALAEPRAVARMVRTAGFVLMAVAFLAVLATGRVAWLALLAGGGLPLLARVRALASGWLRGGTARTPPPRRSTVASRFLQMTLDHDSGAMTGTVLEGPLRGRDLAGLSQRQLGDLYRLCLGGDAESARLLEAWLDRHGPADWRAKLGPDAAAGGPGAGPGGAARGGLTREEAYRILGLEPGADRAAVEAAYRSLMKKLHPDLGGSAWLAARINEARDLLAG